MVRDLAVLALMQVVRMLSVVPFKNVARKVGGDSAVLCEVQERCSLICTPGNMMASIHKDACWPCVVSMHHYEVDFLLFPLCLKSSC